MKDIQRVLKYLPTARTSFAYGSGVFQQHKHSSPSSNMLDLIIVTNNAFVWHQENLKLNFDHYSFLKRFGAKKIAYIQENLGAGVYFNTMLKVNGRSLKYGVVSEHSLLNDLFSWQFLYLSGRLHKPVEWVGEVEPELEKALHYNLNAALITSLLLLPPSFSEQELFVAIASLSYVGDFRMHIGEDRRKVENIVLGNFSRFQKLYQETISRNSEILHWNKEKGLYTQDTTPQSTLSCLSKLPEHLLKGLVEHTNSHNEALKHLSNDRFECSKTLKRQIAFITSNSSWSQSAKSFLSAGVSKSFNYAWRKLLKHYKSL